MARSASWQREARRAFSLYTAVGLAFAPWGAAYAALRLADYDNPTLLVLALAFGFGSALLVARMLKARWYTAAMGKRLSPTLSPSLTYSVSSLPTLATGATAVSFIATISIGQPTISSAFPTPRIQAASATLLLRSV